MQTLRNWLTAKSWTQEDLGEKLGIDRIRLSRYINGKTRIDLAIAKKLEAVTGIPWMVLLQENHEAYYKNKKETSYAEMGQESV